MSLQFQHRVSRSSNKLSAGAYQQYFLRTQTVTISVSRRPTCNLYCYYIKVYNTIYEQNTHPSTELNEICNGCRRDGRSLNYRFGYTISLSRFLYLSLIPTQHLHPFLVFHSHKHKLLYIKRWSQTLVYSKVFIIIT